MAADHLPILIGVEIDAERLPEGAPRTTIDRNSAEQLLAHLATDLAALAPGARHCSLALSGALYDPTEILRPGYPVFAALAQLQKHAGDQGPRLLSVGADGERMPLDGLQPGSAVPRGALQLLALSLSGPADELELIAEEAEYRFLEEGQLSAHTAKAVEAHFRLATAHARFMTLTDMQAMLRLQLEHFGFLPLWELLQAALEQDDEPLEVRAAQGQQFQWTGDRVLARFETFDYWASHGGGAELPADEAALASAYGAWTRGYRQFLITLRAHDVPLEQHLPGSTTPLSGEFLLEDTGPVHGDDEIAGITEHSCDDTGMIAVSVIDDGRLLNYYPLAAAGVDALHARIRASSSGCGLSYPGTMVIDTASRRLAPDTLADSASA
ncbi:hypothetical protein F3N42_11280 [Marinihelvus fidelis]|uniref:Uncharacterized protein n=1 Tax=Marinihelvus fidelis TaxID=2613842 RepID=A0A5N0T7J7_9GAMM|nr:hypothetical protein [Marinihelvus fidelis]KAA9130930.1 hypothetical protein F3N42_11280 [Marinihelvus fidelis]